jgi:hypothetical protein
VKEISMRAIDCGCGKHLEGADTIALLRATREHVAQAHPEMKLTDDEVAVLIAVDAYTVGAATVPPQTPTGRP